MQITIKTLDGQKKPFNFEPEDTVLKVKEMLAEKTGIYKEMIRLIFHGTPLADEMSLAQAKVKAGDVIHMIMQLRGTCCNFTLSHCRVVLLLIHSLWFRWSILNLAAKLLRSSDLSPSASFP